MNFFSVFLVSMVSLISMGQSNDWQKMKLKGKPKIVVRTSQSKEYTLKQTDSFSKKGMLTGTVSEYNGNTNRTVYDYSAEGKLIKETVYTNNEITSQIVYTYDNEGNAIKSYLVGGEGEEAWDGNRHEYKYDENGNILEETVLASYIVRLINGEASYVLSQSIFKYTFDKTGNWVKQEKLTKGHFIGKEYSPDTTVIRIITYY